MFRVISAAILIAASQPSLASGLGAIAVTELQDSAFANKAHRLRITYDAESFGPAIDVTLGRGRITLNIANYFELPVSEAPVSYADANALREDLLIGLEFDDPGERSFFLSYMINW